LALLIVQVFETSYAAGFLMAVAVGAVLSGLLCVIGWVQIRAGGCFWALAAGTGSRPALDQESARA
jgi:hypothetical protein